MSDKLSKLFAKNHEVKENLVEVSSGFYLGSLPKGITAEQANAVNEHNAKFMSTSLEYSKDVLCNTLKTNSDFDGVQASFATGVDGFSFNHSVNKVDTETGYDVYSSLEMDFGPESELNNIYDIIHQQLSDDSE